MSDALAGTYQSRFELGARVSHSAQSVATMEDLAKGPPSGLLSLGHYPLHGGAVEKELLTVAA